MLLQVTQAFYLKDYQIEVVFNDGKKGIVDLSESLNGKVFEPLKNLGAFKSFSVDEELETIVWANGADLAPEYIYYQAFKNEPELQAQFKKWGYVK